MRAGFAALFGTMCAHQQLETARDALFLASIPADRLPWMYIGIAIAASLIAWWQRTRTTSSGGSCRPLAALMTFFGVSTLAFNPLVGSGLEWGIYAFYIWTSVLVAVVVVRVWTLIGSGMTASQARRLFSTITLGSVTGAVAGTALARLITTYQPPETLLFSGGATLVGTALFVLPFLHDSDGDAEVRSVDEQPIVRTTKAWVGEIMSISYARVVLMFALAGVFATTTADFVFKSAVSAVIPADELGQFFSTVYLGANVLSLVAQLFVSGWLVRTIGAAGAAALLPLLIAVGSGVVAGGAVFAGALVLILSDGMLEHSVNRTATEILYVPFRDSLRRRLKEAIELVVRNVGKSGASVLLLIVSFFGMPLRWIAVMAFSFAVLWLLTAWRARRAWGEYFRTALRQEVIHGATQLPDVDIDSVGELMLGLSVPVDDIALGTLRVMQVERLAHLIPPMVLYHPSLEVVEEALRVFVAEERTELVPFLDRLVTISDDPVRRGRFLLARGVLQPERGFLETAASLDCVLCRTTSAVLLAAHGWMPPEESSAVIRSAMASESVYLRRTLTLAMRAVGSGHEPELSILAADSDDVVSSEALEALGERKSAAALRVLLALIAEEPNDGRIAKALGEHGEPAIDDLQRLLEDPSERMEVRRRYVEALGAIDTEASTLALSRLLTKEQDGATRYRIVRALERDRHSIRLSSESRRQLQTTTDALVRRVDDSLDSLVSLRTALERSGTVDEELEALLDLMVSRDAAHLETVLRIQAILHRRVDADALLFAIGGGDSRPREYGREVVDSMLRGNVRGLLNRAIELFVDHTPAEIEEGVDGRLLVERALKSLSDHPSSAFRRIARRQLERLGEVQMGRELALTRKSPVYSVPAF